MFERRLPSECRSTPDRGRSKAMPRRPHSQPRSPACKMRRHAPDVRSIASAHMSRLGRAYVGLCLGRIPRLADTESAALPRSSTSLPPSTRRHTRRVPHGLFQGRKENNASAQRRGRAPAAERGAEGRPALQQPRCGHLLGGGRPQHVQRLTVRDVCCRVRLQQVSSEAALSHHNTSRHNTTHHLSQHATLYHHITSQQITSHRVTMQDNTTERNTA